jgi:hypothetical protein
MFNLDIPILTKLFAFYKEATQSISSFPKTKRYSLGQKIDQVTLDMIELIMTAGYQVRETKLPILEKTSIKLDLLKMLFRLSWETKCVDNNSYQKLSSQLIEIGKMLGGWIKTVKQ